MRSENYWMNWTCSPMQFFMDGPVQYNVAAFDCIFLLPKDITRALPEGLVHSTQALTSLYSQGYPTRTEDEHRRFVAALKSAGLLKQWSEPGSVFPTEEGLSVLRGAGLV